MSARLDRRFEELRARRETALVGYLTAGDPNPAASFDILLAACRAGLDVLELGIPFSDPTVDGPVIQSASHRALQAGMSVAGVLELARKLRAHTETPLILFSYFNPLLQYGLEKLAADARAAGVDGLLVVDLPPEEAEELTRFLPAAELPLIRLVAPTTPEDRLPLITGHAGGFLYAITRTGVTGTGTFDPVAVRDQITRLRRVSPLPICLGFGIRTPDDARRLAPLADGIVVGSALVQIIASHAQAPNLPARVAEAVSALKAALAPAP